MLNRISIKSLVLIVLYSLATDVIGAPVMRVISGPDTLNGETLCQLGDGMTLVVTDTGKELIRYNYCSSYGNSSVQSVTDMRGTSYILLKYGEGHGTCAVTEYLDVFRVRSEVFEYLRTPISWYVQDPKFNRPMCAKASYAYTVSTPKTGGVQLTLDLNGPDPDAEKRRTIVIDGQ